MSPGHAKHVLLHAKIRRSLQSGRYMPGEWLDYAALAAEFHTSDMPVRLALHRLIGEGLLEPHARGGVHLPLPTEVELRDRYTWLQHMLQAPQPDCSAKASSGPGGAPVRGSRSIWSPAPNQAGIDWT